MESQGGQITHGEETQGYYKRGTPNWPDPPDEAAYHGLVGDIVRVIEPHSEADPIALLLQFLTAFGNVIGRTSHFVVEADHHSLNLFVVLVGVTSRSRKGSSWGHTLRFFKEVEKGWAENRVQSGLSSGEGLIWAIRDFISKEDPGVGDKRLMVLESEFASTLRVMGRDGSTLSPVIRQGWDTGDLRVLTKNSPAQATGAHISIIGHITKDELLRYLNNTEAGNGFGNRFLWACVGRSKCLPEGGHIEEVDLTFLVKHLKEAVEFSGKAGELKRDEKASAIWREVYPELSKGALGLLGAVTSRAEAQVMRLSCLYALLDMSYVVRVEHLKAALALWGYCEASARYIFGDNVGDPVADEILRALCTSPEGMTRTGIRDLFGRNRNTSVIGQALALLAEHGLARSVCERTDGRPVERWIALSLSTIKTT